MIPSAFAWFAFMSGLISGVMVCIIVAILLTW
jgi:hypothetical protein